MSYQFLAGSGFSQDQYGGVGWRYSLHFSQHELQGGTATDYSVERSLIFIQFIRSNSVHLVYGRFHRSISDIPFLKMTMVRLGIREQKSFGCHRIPLLKTTMVFCRREAPPSL
jgi:hypothetical protein